MYGVLPEISPTNSLTNAFFAFDNFHNKDVEISTFLEQLKIIKICEKF